MSNDDRAFVRWQQVGIKQLSYVNDILILLATGMFGFQIQFGFNEIIQLSSYKLVFMVSMFLFFISILAGIYCAWNRLKSFRKTSKVSRNSELILEKTEIKLTEDKIEELIKENEKLRREYDILDDRTWVLLPVQALLFSGGAILLFVFALLEIL